MKLIVGNWKMHANSNEARNLASTIVNNLTEPGMNSHVSVAVCPPFPYLPLVRQIIQGTCVGLGAQNLFPEKEGAFTGEVSPSMLIDLGCKYVILGHSERRQKFSESDEFINKKVRVALSEGLHVILCIGETLSQRNSSETEAVLDRQLIYGLAGVATQYLSKLTIAYEPLWAIGRSGRHATPEQVEKAHAIIRKKFAQLFDENSAQALCIQYGGSVHPDNVAALLSTQGVDGALIGGASLNAEDFLSIIKAVSQICLSSIQGPTHQAQTKGSAA
jgi:triosephosphate isomerase